jgi:hypothetical protein
MSEAVRTETAHPRRTIRSVAAVLAGIVVDVLPGKGVWAGRFRLFFLDSGSYQAPVFAALLFWGFN